MPCGTISSWNTTNFPVSAEKAEQKSSRKSAGRKSRATLPAFDGIGLKDAKGHAGAVEKRTTASRFPFPSVNEAQDIKDTKASFIPSPVGTKIRRKSHPMLCRTTQHAQIAGPRCLCVAPL